MKSHRFYVLIFVYSVYVCTVVLTYSIFDSLTTHYNSRQDGIAAAAVILLSCTYSMNAVNFKKGTVIRSLKGRLQLLLHLFKK